MKLAAGILPYCSETKRFLLAKRGPKISNPNQWTNFGGKAEKGESSVQTAIREFREESGYKGSVKIISKGYPIQNKKDGFVFVTYIGEVKNEFEPSTIGKQTVDGDVEVSDAKWVTFEQLMKLRGNSNLHPGFNQFLNNLRGNKTVTRKEITEMIKRIYHEEIDPVAQASASSLLLMDKLRKSPTFQQMASKIELPSDKFKAIKQFASLLGIPEQRFFDFCTQQNNLTQQ